MIFQTIGCVKQNIADTSWCPAVIIWFIYPINCTWWFIPLSQSVSSPQLYVAVCFRISVLIDHIRIFLNIWIQVCVDMWLVIWCCFYIYIIIYIHTYIHTILYYTILYYTILYHTIPYHTIPLYYITLHYIHTICSCICSVELCVFAIAYLTNAMWQGMLTVAQPPDDPHRWWPHHWIVLKCGLS